VKSSRPSAARENADGVADDMAKGTPQAVRVGAFALRECTGVTAPSGAMRQKPVPTGRASLSKPARPLTTTLPSEAHCMASALAKSGRAGSMNGFEMVTRGRVFAAENFRP
jgi:hypothetical protein